MLEDERLGLMQCYCNTLSTDHIIYEVFNDVDPNGSDKRNHCYEWAWNLTIHKAMVIGSSLIVVTINIIACTIFDLTIVMEKNHTTNDDSKNQFRRILFMQWFNIAVIGLIINLKLKFDRDGVLFDLPIFNGEYKDFSAKWYVFVGKQLIITLLMTIFTPHASKLLIPALKVLRRYYDRGFRYNIKKDPLDPLSDKINTRKLV